MKTKGKEAGSQLGKQHKYRHISEVSAHVSVSV